MIRAAMLLLLKSETMQADELKQIIEDGIPSAQVTIQGDGDHFEATIVSEAFAGKSMVQQHQMVYAALGGLMQGPVHALSFRTFTPQQWSKQIQ
jgi:acid stress-induced BolA-like protein IbaG/YrbA